MYSHLQVAERKCETMDPDCGTRYNPWSIDDSAAGLRNALLIAEKTGHVRKRTKVEESEMTTREEIPSMQMIKLLKEISHYNIEINQVNAGMQKRMLYHNTRDIMDISVIEKRTEKVKQISDHLQAVTANKDALITWLQQLHLGDYIKLQKTFHRHASELFSQLAPLLSDLLANLDDLAWVNSSTFAQSQLDTLVTELSGALASIQSHFQAITRMSQYIHNLNNVGDLH